MLGMVLKQQKWHCRYVEEYLAVGEAPEQVRNCFQQRSRWCKVRAYCPHRRLEEAGSVFLVGKNGVRLVGCCIASAKPCATASKPDMRCTESL